MKQVWQIVQHEWLRQRVNPATYLLLIVVGIVWYFLFFRQFFLIGQASLRPLFELFPWFAIILMPALAMGSLAKEKSEQTLELLLTHPVSELRVVIGKFVSVSFIPVLLSLTTLPLALAISVLGTFDWGAYLVQILATWFVSGLLLSLSLMLSAFLSDQVAAVLVSSAASFGWLLVGFELVTARLPLQLSNLVSNLAFLPHVNSLFRGVIDSRDIWYFLSVSALFLSLCYLYLLRQKYGRNKRGYRLLQQVVLLFAIVVVLTNILGQAIPGRIDVTQSRLYSLSPSTKTVLTQLPDVVTVTLYASRTVPTQLQPVLRDTKDILADYQRYGGGRVQLITKDPGVDQELQTEAKDLGVQEVQFNTISQEQFNVSSGYFGLVIAYADQHQTIPFVQNTDQLEYQITTLIYQMTRQDKPVVALAAGHGEKSTFGELSFWGVEASKQFELVDANLLVEDGALVESFPSQAQAIMIVAPTAQYESPVLEAIESYVQNGGSLFVLASGMTADPQSQTVIPVEHNLNQLLEKFHLKIEPNFVYDMRANEVIRVGQGIVQYVTPYPLWVRAQTVENNPIISVPQSTTITWGSSLTAQSESLSESGWQLQPLIATSEFAGTIDSPTSVAPDQTFSETDLSTQIIGAALIPSSDSQRGKVVIVGSGDMLINELVQAAPGNATVGLATLSWLTGDTVLSELTTKTAIDRTMRLLWSQQTTALTGIGYGVAVGIPLLLGGWQFWQRRRKIRTSFGSGKTIIL